MSILNSYNVPVSFGELVDKISILNLKKKYIYDPEKAKNIQNELDLLPKLPTDARTTHLYNLLYIINDIIWNISEQIQDMNIPNIELFSQLYHENGARFRVKQMLNQTSLLKEEKSYNKTTVLFIMTKLNKTEIKVHTELLKLYYDVVETDVLTDSDVNFVYDPSGGVPFRLSYMYGHGKHKLLKELERYLLTSKVPQVALANC